MMKNERKRTVPIFDVFHFSIRGCRGNWTIPKKRHEIQVKIFGENGIDKSDKDNLGSALPLRRWERRKNVFTLGISTKLRDDRDSFINLHPKYDEIR